MFWLILLRMAQSQDDLILIAKSLGFTRVGVVAMDVTSRESEDPRWSDVMAQYRAWLASGYAGDMDYLDRHAGLRAAPEQLLDGDGRCLSAIAVTMDYLRDQDGSADPQDWRDRHWQAVSDPGRAVVSHYAHGRDYHKVLRSRLVKLARSWAGASGFRFRACVDSAPVLEVEIARRAGLGWRGKHTLLLNREQGSMSFLGVVLTDMPLSPMPFESALTESPQGHCGSCVQCLDVCPTRAFVGPYQLDARRCISYLTIEHSGSIPVALRPLIGNRVYGCDDCQAVCPWNQFARTASVSDFDVRHGLHHQRLVALFSWTEQEFNDRHQGSAILRVGYVRWLRNLAVAMGNAFASPALAPDERDALEQALRGRQDHPSELVREHVLWALSKAGDAVPRTTG